MTLINVALNCIGKIHDHDFGFWDADEEESYNWAEVLQLNAGGADRNWSREKTVDGEVKLKLDLTLRLSTEYVLSVWGVLQLQEGGAWWTIDDSAGIPATHIGAGQNATLYNGTLANSGGDWAAALLTANVAPAPQVPDTGPSFKDDTDETFGDRVTVVAESSSGRNIGFKDLATGRIMSRREFVDATQQGFYANYYVRSIDGVATPVSKPNETVGDNLG